jgi:hypothetical protein
MTISVSCCCDRSKLIGHLIVAKFGVDAIYLKAGTFFRLRMGLTHAHAPRSA